MKSKLFFLLVIGFISLTTFTFAQWIPTGGPEGGATGRCLERVGNTIWNGSSNGIYVSGNEGASWSRHPAFYDLCSDIKCFGDTIVVLYIDITTGAMDEYMEYTTTSFDGGLTWSSPAFIESPFTISPNKIFRTGNALIKPSQWDLFISHDFGLSWSIMPFPFGDNFGAIYSDDISMLLEMNNTSTMQNRLYRTSDGAQTWTFIDSIYTQYGNYNNFLIQDSLILMNTAVYDSVWHAWVVRSLDDGLTWDTTYTFQPGVIGNSLIYFNGTVIDYGFPNSIVSSDDGLTWSTITFPPDYNLNSSQDLLLLSNGDYLNSSGNRIIRFVPTQGTYYYTETGISAQNINTLTAHQGTLYCGYGTAGFKSGNGGITWSSLLPFPIVPNDFVFRGDTILCVNHGGIGYLAKSFDNGQTWDSVRAPVGISWFDPTSLEEFNGRLFVTSDSISYSDDWGLTWNALNFGHDSVPGNCIGTPIELGDLQKIDTSLYIVTNDGIVARYNAQNQLWNFLYCFWSTGAANNNRLYDIDNYIAVVGRPGLFISSDNGLTWTEPIGNGLPLDYSGRPIFPYNLISVGGSWFGTCGSHGIYFSNDHGENWLPMQVGPVPFFARGGLTLLNNILYSGSYCNGVWRMEGSLDLISGTVYSDDNNNGNHDVNEAGLPHIAVRTAPSGIYTCTDSTGFYTILSYAVGDTLTIVKPSTFASVNPTHYFTNGAATNRDFGVYMPQNIRDLTIDITNVNVFRPGFQTTLGVTVANNGSYPQPPEVTVVLDTALQFVSASNPPDLINGDSLTWFTDTLNFMETHFFSITVTTSILSNIGDTIVCYAIAEPIPLDTFPADNESRLVVAIVGSYDPNDKQCMQGEYFTPDQLQNNEELFYVVRFQNTGNFPADFVTIRDTLSHLLDITTFRVVASSHPMTWSMSSHGVVEFVFDNINLPPSSTDELHSHGYVKYAVRCSDDAVIGNALVNTANIYFDFNPAVVTNTTTTLIAYPVILLQEELHAVIAGEIVVYPNPTSGGLKIDLRGVNSDDLILRVYDIHGHLVKKESMNRSTIHSSSFSQFQNGIYFGELFNEKERVGSFKFILQK